MSISFDLRSSVPADVRERGSAVYAMRKVTLHAGDREFARATVQGSQEYEVYLRREEDDVFASCECPFYDSNGVCKHIWATLLATERYGYLIGRNGRRARTLSEDLEEYEDEEDEDEEEEEFDLTPPSFQPRRTTAPKAPPQPQWKHLLGQLPPDIRTASSLPVDRELYYILDLRDTQWDVGIQLELQCRERKKDGQWGKLKEARLSRQAIAQMPADADREILMIVSGAQTTYDWPGRDTVPYGYRLDGAMAPLLLARLCATGRCLWRRNRTDTLENMVRLSVDEGPPWEFSLSLNRAGESWVLRGEFSREEERFPLEQAEMIFPSGLLLKGGSFARYEGKGALKWSQLLRRTGPIPIPVHDGDQFLAHMLQQPDMPVIHWPEELQFVESTPEFQPCLQIEARQQRGSGGDVLCAYISFRYGDAELPMNYPAAGLFHPEKRMLLRRNLEAEEARLHELSKLGFKPEPATYESDAHFHLAAKKLATSVRDLIRSGWHVEMQGRPFRKPSGSRTELTSGVDWFELRTTVDYDGAVAQLPDLLKAVKEKSTLVELSDGSLGMMPEELMQQLAALVGTGKATGDHLRFSRVQTGLLDALLASRPEVNVDETFLRAREHLRSFERIQPACQPNGFKGTLRNYQCDGLSWMRFLQDLGFGGCLADDMGLGKTAQVLALLEQRRELRQKDESIGPSLVVVPRSLVFNWIQEAQRFTPQLRVLDHSGSGRKRLEASFSDYDLVLMTYGTVRRDIAILQGVRFDYAILDEAQAIKNADSDSAKSVRLLESNYRLALSGTPIQNHLGELVSLFEFLNPGMLGSIKAFSAAGLSLREPDQVTREMLSMAVRPFLLRRTKDQVARELPERTEQTIYCELDAGERRQYDDLRKHYRFSLMGRIEEQGIAKSQMHILEALLRLRQAACHPGLLDPKRKTDPSAKLDTLLANLAEVLSEGHKALVFSQFTSLLSIVRASLDRDKITYEYLDGRTRDRESRVQRFQADPACKLFLISLKAGGVGLNLTAADYVFLLDPWWNPAVEAQAIDRTHRIGQTSHVFAYRLIARDTVEEKVLELQGRKRDLADAIIRADASLVGNLKREDLEFLLS